ncbi:hypothetical protein C772_01318 [Bhargavaea cecembensis DSE10]|uniref:Uncharacterized protein n=1 Tax=Bhargavaea cecembensis DSE10 TaxID=1235279 RepID=M7NYR6_9BACL|nr:hypothetical protein [Bhargavaea cecembensis]EMR06790.1 hypothetical protein C772_01318 [Bhargavaea cecembensis DSE10]
MSDDENQFIKLIEDNYLGDSRVRVRRKLELLLEDLPKGIEKANAGDAEYAAVYLVAIEKILAAALDEESIAYERFMTKRD